MIYIPSVPKNFFDKNPFSEDQRIIPIEIPYGLSRQLSFSMSIPEGYRLEEIPEQIGIAVSNNKGKFVYTFSIIRK